MTEIKELYERFLASNSKVNELMDSLNRLCAEINHTLDKNS